MFRTQNLCPGSKNVFDSRQKHFLFSEQQNLFPQHTFPAQLNWETLASATMFPQQCFLVYPGLKQTRRHLKIRVSAIIFQLFKLIMLEKCVVTILELNWNQRLGHKKTKLNICHHMLTSSTQLQNRSFHVVVERTRTSAKCQKIKYARAKRAKILFFIVKYVKYCGVFVAVVVVVA